MPCRAWQYNSAIPVARVYSMRVDFGGIVPMFALGSYAHGRGRMEGRLLGVVGVARAEGHETDLGELVTFVNDALVVTPAMLLRPWVTWSPVDEASFDVTVADAGLTVTGRATVDHLGRLVSSSTDDRWCALPEGLVRARYHGGGRVDRHSRPPGSRACLGHMGAARGPFTYAVGRFVPESLSFDVPPPSGTRQTRRVPRS